MRPPIDLNCDLGEGGPDETLIPLCGRVNVATGGHAGDDASIRVAITLALRHGVLLGAHPSYPDREGFGRRELNLSADAIGNAVREQLARFVSVAAQSGATVAHVKPHGAMYHRANTDADAARAIVDAVRSVDPALAIVGQPNTAIARECVRRGTPFLGEFFADRRYRADGSLVPRARQDAVIESPDEAINQVRLLLQERVAIADDGTRIPVGAINTICVHGDGATAVALLTRLRDAFFA